LPNDCFFMLMVEYETGTASRECSTNIIPGQLFNVPQIIYSAANAAVPGWYQLIFLLAYITKDNTMNRPMLPMSKAVSSSLINTKMNAYSTLISDAKMPPVFRF
jgi:hypothetical protein